MRFTRTYKYSFIGLLRDKRGITLQSKLLSVIVYSICDGLCYINVEHRLLRDA